MFFIQRKAAIVRITMNQIGAGTPNQRAWASWNAGGRLLIHLPPVTLTRPPLRIESMPRVTTIDGSRP